MTTDRRAFLAYRRRKILATQHGDGRTGDKSRPISCLRQARRPYAAYGSRVRRRLRMRWYGLVPVHFSTFVLVSGLVVLTTVLLIVGHLAANRWSRLAYAPELARPLQLNRSDCFGTWFALLLLLSAAGFAFLIYQLRRYRNDDFAGSYRIWRPTIVVICVASVDYAAGLSPWLGELLDVAIGTRKALSGGDWLRLIYLVGGMAFAVRMVKELWQSRFASVTLGISACLALLPISVHLRFLQAEHHLAKVLLAAAPLTATVGLWLALLTYLRVLYREVKQIEDNGLSLRISLPKFSLRQWWSNGPVEPQSTPERKESVVGSTRRKATSIAKPSASEPVTSARGRAENRNGEAERSGADQAVKPEDSRRRTPRFKLPRISLSLRKKRASQASPDNRDDEPGAAQRPPDAKAARGKPEAATAEQTTPRKRRFGMSFPRLRGGSGRSSETPPEDAAAMSKQPQSEVGNAAAANQNSNHRSQPTMPETDIDPSTIDWGSLNKSERRRLKRQIERQNKAA